MEKIRKFENFHILLWLLKDTSWLMGWKIFGMFMILPTLSFAAFITWKTREWKFDFLPNIAILFWISANSFWMFTEFFPQFERLKNYAAIPFAIGLTTISIYTISLLRKDS